MKTTRLKKYALLTLLAGAPLLFSGCFLTHPGGTSMAYVEIDGVSIDRAREAAAEIFSAEHYQIESDKGPEIVFVREGTLNDRLQYARYGESLYMRVIVTFEDYGPGTVLVRADAFAVTGGSDRSATQLLRIARRPYMKLLRRVRDLAEANEQLEGK